MSRFLFAPLPGAGHVHPMLPVAAELVRRGEQVDIWVTPPFAAAAAGTGATVHLRDAPPFPAPVQRPNPRLVLTVLRSLLRPPQDLLDAAAVAEPGTVVVHDAMTGSWGRKIGLPAVAFACTTVITGRTITADLAALLTRRTPTRTARVRERLLRSPLPRLLDRLPNPMSAGGPLTLVSVPRVFQPSVEEFGPEIEFVGPCLEPRAGDVDHPLLDRIADDGRPLVLVSLGTANNLRSDFYRACFAAFDGMPWQVVLAAGERTDIAALGTPPPNVLVAPRVPQLEVLEQANVFVSHAGMGSTMESLSAGVPMVTFPQQPEQRANARRIVAHGAGVPLPRTPTPENIRSAVARVLDDPDVGTAVRRLQAAVRASGGQRQAADAVQRFARSPTPATR